MFAVSYGAPSIINYKVSDAAARSDELAETSEDLETSDIKQSTSTIYEDVAIR